MSYLLGLTGSIGMGKSTTSGFFRDFGVPVWDADAAVAQLYAKNGAGVAAIAAIHPELIADGLVNRAALRDWIARDPAHLTQIEAAIHPLVAADRARFVEDHRDHALVLLDIPLLFEIGAEKDVDGVLVVTTDAQTQKARVMARPNMSEEFLANILARQLPDSDKRARADFVIETNSLDQTKSAVRDLIARLTRG